MPSAERPDHVHCIRYSEGLDPERKTWCGRPMAPLDWFFTGAEHAALSVLKGSYPVPCQECRRAVIMALEPNAEALAAGPWVLASERLPEEHVLTLYLVECELGQLWLAARADGRWVFRDAVRPPSHEVLRWAEVKP